jgi:hypothetical protein
MLAKVENLDEYGANDRVLTDNLDEANVITSAVKATAGMTHKVVLDIDLPAKLVPSSTEGHFHLYIDHEVAWPKYEALLDALADAGIVEQGYVGASVARGFTAARLPWIRKASAAEVTE